MRIGRAAGLTDTGRRRLQNEDSFVCEPPLFAVADGVGGAQAGELASSLAATAIEEGGELRDEAAITALVLRANARVYEHSIRDPLATGMGTTATLVHVDEEAAAYLIGHVGDSRAYLWRSGALTQLTDDHSLVAELVRSGRLTEEEAAVHPHKSAITRVLGTDSTVLVDTATVPAQPGDLVILCSDGLPTMVADDRIAAILGESTSPDAVCDALVRAANDAGGEDNTTVVAFELIEGEPPARPRREQPAASEPQTAAEPLGPDVVTPPSARRHGAGKGSRWPALLFLAAVAVVGLLALWWSIGR
ncbi:MAG: Stp1/IreP family PP2C-type Ser/Thr phosphatase [Gaiellales bacterium]